MMFGLYFGNDWYLIKIGVGFLGINIEFILYGYKIMSMRRELMMI